MADRFRVLFLCAGNTCRRQMAEGWARHVLKDRVEPCSAGADPGRPDHRAVAVMAEVGVDISHERSKSVAEVLETPFDPVVIVCNSAVESCPVFPGRVGVVHHGFDDPPRLAADASSAEEALRHYRRVRDDIREYITDLPRFLAFDAKGRSTIPEAPT